VSGAAIDSINPGRCLGQSDPETGIRIPPFVVLAKVKGFEPVTGEGGTKRQAEQDAAAKLLAIVVPGQ